jgi:endonuclease III related protein
MHMSREHGGHRRYRGLVKRRRSPPLAKVYELLRDRFGHAGWWPADTAFEVCLGAILAQNTAWTNVEKALHAIRSRRLLSHRALFPLRHAAIARMIRPSGTFQVKARRVRAFLDFLESEYGGVAERMTGTRLEALRASLLRVHGIGPETADCIVLYVAGQPSFVVDAYTRRVFERLGVLRGGESYEQAQRVFHEGLPADPALFGDYHAQIVRLAKDVCRPRPLCAPCPLDAVCAKVGVARA